MSWFSEHILNPIGLGNDDVKEANNAAASTQTDEATRIADEQIRIQEEILALAYEQAAIQADYLAEAEALAEQAKEQQIRATRAEAKEVARRMEEQHKQEMALGRVSAGASNFATLESGGYQNVLNAMEKEFGLEVDWLKKATKLQVGVIETSTAAALAEYAAMGAQNQYQLQLAGLTSEQNVLSIESALSSTLASIDAARRSANASAGDSWLDFGLKIAAIAAPYYFAPAAASIWAPSVTSGGGTAFGTTAFVGA